ARLIPVLHVREASELAYYGAKVLHPRSLIALQAGTRLIIRPYADPAAHGTEIVVERERKPATGRARRPVKALTAIADQTLPTIAGTGMDGDAGAAGWRGGAWWESPRGRGSGTSPWSSGGAMPPRRSARFIRHSGSARSAAGLPFTRSTRML